MYSHAKLVDMSAMRGRERRQDNLPTVLLQTRVKPEVREAVREAADRSGVSIARYLDEFLFSLMDEKDGSLPTISVQRRPKDLELPISDVA